MPNLMSEGAPSPGVYKQNFNKIYALLLSELKSNLPQDFVHHICSFIVAGTKHISTQSFHNDFTIDLVSKSFRYGQALQMIDQFKKETTDTTEFASSIYKTILNQVSSKAVEQSSYDVAEGRIKVLEHSLETVNQQRVEALNKIEELDEELHEAYKTADLLRETVDALEKSQENIQPKYFNITLPRGDIIKIEKRTHFMFERVLKSLSARNHNGFTEFVYGWGAPASGKTVMGSQLSEALGVRYYPHPCTPTTTESKITGFNNMATGSYVKGIAYDAYKNGGLVALDEVDKSDPAVLAGACNSLENAEYTFGNEVVKRHPDFYLVAWANTKGTGSTGGFASNKLDAATLSRFTMIEIVYDEGLEFHIAGKQNKDWVEYVHKVREHIKEHCNDSIYITTRMIRKGAAYLDAGNKPIQDIVDEVLFPLMTKAQRQAVLVNCGTFRDYDQNR